MLWMELTNLKYFSLISFQWKFSNGLIGHPTWIRHLLSLNAIGDVSSCLYTDNRTFNGILKVNKSKGMIFGREGHLGTWCIGEISFNTRRKSFFCARKSICLLTDLLFGMYCRHNPMPFEFYNVYVSEDHHSVRCDREIQ